MLTEHLYSTYQIQNALFWLLIASAIFVGACALLKLQRFVLELTDRAADEQRAGEFQERRRSARYVKQNIRALDDRDS